MAADSTDVIVVGGGIAGLSIALQLKLLGIPRVTVLERHHVGAGQSGRAAGIVRALVNHPQVAAMLMASLKFLEGFNARFDESIVVNRTGYLLIDRAERAAALRQVIQNAASAGCEAELISPEAALRLQPGLGVGSDVICAFEPAAIHVDPMPVTQAFARVARRLGVEIVEGTEVTGLLVERGRVQGVTTKSGLRPAGQVVIATAAWGAAQLKQVGIDVPVYSHRVEMAFFAVPSRSARRLERVLSDARTLLYLRPEGRDLMFVGWREGDRIAGIRDFAQVDPDSYRQTSHYDSLADMRRRLIQSLPFMSEGFVHRTYACVYDYTPDGMPILDEAEAITGLYFALGYSGGGFSLSPWVGSAMAKFIAMGVKPPELRLLRLRRFQEGELVGWSNAGPR